MRNSVKKTLIALFTSVLAVMMLFVVATNMRVLKASAEVSKVEFDAPMVSGEYIDDFYMIDGASVRIETEGIKFTTVISKAYLQVLESQGQVEFLATAKKVGGTAMFVAFKDQPSSQTMEGDTYELNTYLNFNNYTGDMSAALKTDFVVETCAKITPTEGAPTYIRAYKPEGNEIVRSMQAVANAYYLDKGDTAVEKYFTVGSRSENKEGYFFIDNTGVITMAGMPKVNDVQNIKVYYGARQLDATYTDGQITFNGLNIEENKTEGYISVFADGKVYSSKIEDAVKITQENANNLLTLTGDETVYLAEDIDLSKITWNTTVAFSGVLDGGNHVIKNLVVENSNGFFKDVKGATIKNVAFTNVDLSNGSNGAITYRPTGGLTVNNVFIQVAKTPSLGRVGAICERSTAQVALNLTDVVISMPYTNSNEAIYGWALSGMSLLTNVHCIGLPNASASIGNVAANLSGSSTYTLHTSVENFAKTKVSLTNFVNKCVKEYLDTLNIVKIQKDNAKDLLSLTGGETVYLAEDIDLSKITWNTAVTFSGVLDGGNHVIKNLVVENSNGFFKDVKGATIKNVAFTNVDLSNGSNGAITYRPTGGLTVNNVFIQVAKTPSLGRVGAICERSTAQVALNLTDVVISMPYTNSNEAIYGWALSGMSLLTNVHCIGLPNASASIGNVAANLSGSSTYTLHVDFAAFNSAEKNLTDFMASCVNDYLN